MSKRNVTYIKQEEPSFLKKLKLESGFKEGPTVDTKVFKRSLFNYKLYRKRSTIRPLQSIYTLCYSVKNYRS
ncbi:hypothetical protein PGB90_006882 [Kerria lacca]